ncbi:MAG: hypothetical protein AAF587_18090 [Bacteroidota bacterium]
MMYLVLLAILALNVSPEILDAFKSIRTQLQETATEANMNSLSFVGQMKDAIDMEVANEGKRHNIGMKDTLDQIRDRTVAMMDLLNGHIKEMEAIAKYDPKLKDYRVKDELEKNYRYWMGDDEANGRRGNGEAAKLRDSINAYFSYLTYMYNYNLRNEQDKIEARTLQEPPESGEDPGKRWEQYTFEGPVLANMATLEAFKVELFREEKRLLDLLNSRLGIHSFVIDTIIPITAPTSRIIPAGMQFQTRLFVGLSSKEIKPQFRSPSGRVELDNDGNSALLTIPTNANLLRNGLKEATQSYTATIHVPTPTGDYDTITLRDEFIVRKPEAVITSAAIQQLYRNCANPVTIDVPALGDQYNPQISASHATVNQSSRSSKRFQIIPTGNESIISVNSLNQGQVVNIDKIKYNVIEPPKPTIQLGVVSGGSVRAYNGSTSVPAASQFKLKLIPDPEFRGQLREEANYRVKAIEIRLKDGLQPARLVKTMNVLRQDAVSGITFRLPNEVRQARTGARVIINLKEISRKTARGNLVEDKRFPEMATTLTIVLR